VFHRFNPRLNRLTIHTLRDIGPGEELNTSYIDICHPTAVRRQMLKDWGFRCRCVVCDSPDDEEDFRRKKIEDVMAKVRKCEKQAEANRHHWGEKDYRKAMSVIEKGLRLMNTQGMEETDTLGYLLSLAAKYGSRIGRHDEAVDWVDRLIDIEKKCLGEDSNEYEKAIELRQSICAKS
jgi:tetratricopeptide (TPR) repeat protein